MLVNLVVPRIALSGLRLKYTPGMHDLDKKYLEQLETLAAEIQESEELATYLETEEDDDYLQLKEAYEPRIALIYDEVARNKPLQLISFELVLLEDYFEGLFLPKILGYSVLRGDINEQVKYVRPQEHFREVLSAICESANFDILKKRIGQSIQIGFALSSDIWVTSLINSFANKRVRYYLQAQKLEKYRTAEARHTGLKRYKRQFRNDVFLTAEFPETMSELKVLFPSLRNFLIYRANLGEDNSSLMEPIKAFIARDIFKGTEEHLQVMMLFSMFYEMDEDEMILVSEEFNAIREKEDHFEDYFFAYLLDLHLGNELEVTPEADRNISGIMDKTLDDDLSKYYTLIDMIHDKGYNQEEVQEAVKAFISQYEGLSVINECVRQTIFGYFRRFVSNLEESAYVDFFEISRLYPVYMSIFANQQFNQNLKELSMAYVRRLLKQFTDKRGKDYQDIKKFVSTAFLDFEFLSEKQIKELFKTRRKKKKKPTT